MRSVRITLILGVAIFMWNPFGKLRLRRKLGTISNLGVDIGTSTIKVLQLGATAEGEDVRLQTYGQLASYGHIRRFNDAIQTEGFRFFENHVVRLLDTVLEQSGVTARDAVFSIPIFSTFITTMRLPLMDPEEMETAVPLQAQQYVPSPLEEVQLTWMIVGYEGRETPATLTKAAGSASLSGENEEEKESDASSQYVRILLIAAPKDVIQQYVDIADQLDLHLRAIELESIALARSSVPDLSKTTLLLDVGARSTDVTLVDNGLVQLSHNIDVAGEAMTKMLVRSSGGSFLDAERIKRERGFADDTGVAHEEFVSIIDQITREVKRVIGEYNEVASRPVHDIILAGGTSILKGVDSFFKAAFPDTNVLVADPWRGIKTPKVLTNVLQNMGPAYGVAIGLALRQLRSHKAVRRPEEGGVEGLVAASVSGGTSSSMASTSSDSQTVLA